MAHISAESYGASHFLRLGGAQGSLEVGKDTFARRVEQGLHRLVLGNGNRLFPIVYINGLVAFRESDPSLARMPVGRVALQYALTDEAHEHILHAEAEFDAVVESRVTANPGGARFLSATAIAGVLGFSPVTVLSDWAKRPDLLQPAGTLLDAPTGASDTYFSEVTFRNFCTWRHPGQPNDLAT